MKNLITLFALLLFLKPIKAQVAEYYYSDTEQKEGGKIYDHIKYKNTIIIAGRSFDKTKYKPAIIRVDTTGTTLWNTAITDTTIYSGYNVGIGKIMLGDDGNIYAACYDNGNKVELWKVNPDSGTVIWKKSFNYTYMGRLPEFMIDYDSLKFIVSYTTYYTGSVYDTKFAFVSKSNGDTLSSYNIGGIPWALQWYGICIDKNKDIYYSKTDSIYKVSGSNPKNFIWKKQHTSVQVSDFHEIYFDTTISSLFFLGRKSSMTESGTIVKINPSNGALISAYTASTNAVKFCDMKVVNGYIYVTWMHIYVGGGNNVFYCTKYNMSSATADWSIVYYFSTGASSAQSLDVDSNGDVYLTGYYGSANYGPGTWGVLKLNGTSSNAIYGRTITQDSTYHNISIGVAACVFNNTPYFVGELETTHGNNRRSQLTFVKLNPVTGMQEIMKYIEGYYQFPSKTLAIEKYPTSQTIVMKQTGRVVEIEMYNLAKYLLWKKTFAKEYFLLGDNIAIAPNGEIYLTACARQESNSFPFYSDITDSIFIYHLNSTGGIIKQYSFYVGINKSFPIEMHADYAGLLLFYQKYNTIYYRQVYLSTLSNEFNSQINYTSQISRTKYCFNKNTSKAFLFGEISGTTRLIELTRSTLGLTNLAVIPPILKKINYVLEIDNDLVVLCGKNNLNYESLGLYNTYTKDTIWTKQLSSNSNSQVLKCVVDPQRNYIYTISQSLNNIVVRKNNISTGQQKWTYSYNGTDSLDDSPIDISYDPFRDLLLVTGYETNNGNKRAIILMIDTTGESMYTLIKTGDFKGDNSGLCTQILYDQSQWVGGNLNKTSFGPAGFIFEISDSTISPVIRVETSPVLVYEGTSTMKVKSTLWRANGKAASASITNTGTATSSIDYTAPSSTITFPSSAIDGDTIMMTYNINNDTIIESSETIIANIVAVSNALVSGPSKTITIIDDDSPVTITVDTLATQIFEGGGVVKVNFKISNVNGKPSTINISNTGTASNTSDYIAPNAVVTFPASAMNGDSIIVNYNIIDDVILESNETIIAGFSAGTNAIVKGSSKTITIIDNDAPVTYTIDSSSLQVFESAGIVNVKVKISNVNGIASSINITNSGTATVNNDYTVPSVVVNFPATAINGDSIIISYSILDDVFIEGTETILANFTSGTNAMVIGALKTITIIDNETPATITIDTSSMQVFENAGVIRVKLKISNVNGLPAFVNILNSGTAILNSDYSASHVLVIFPYFSVNGDSIFVNYSINDDVIVESSETILAGFSAGNNTEVIGTLKPITILDNDIPPTITIDTSTIQALENAGSIMVKMKISNINGKASSVNITNTGTATISGDYTAPVSIVTFPASATNGDSIMVSYTIIDDALVENNETIISRFSSGGNSIVIGASKTITVFDNDTPATITIDTSTLQVLESIGTFKVKLKISNVNGQASSISITNSGTATLFNDYSPLVSSITFPSTAKNGDSIMLVYTITDDLLKENSETIITGFSSLSNAVVKGSTKTIIILDEDGPANISLDTATLSVNENVGIVKIKLTISNVNGKAATAKLVTSGTAFEVLDYTVSTKNINFPSTALNGDSIIIYFTIKDDVISESFPEWILSSYSSISNCVFNNGTEQKINIIDNDPNGIELINNFSVLQVYPNPFTQYLTVISNNSSISQIMLYDITAKKCLQQSFKDSVILNTELLASGIYIYEIRDETGRIRRGKIIKK